MIATLPISLFELAGLCWRPFSVPLAPRGNSRKLCPFLIHVGPGRPKVQPRRVESQLGCERISRLSPPGYRRARTEPDQWADAASPISDCWWLNGYLYSLLSLLGQGLPDFLESIPHLLSTCSSMFWEAQRTIIYCGVGHVANRPCVLFSTSFSGRSTRGWLELQEQRRHLTSNTDERPRLSCPRGALHSLEHFHERSRSDRKKPRIGPRLSLRARIRPRRNCGAPIRRYDKNCVQRARTCALTPRLAHRLPPLCRSPWRSISQLSHTKAK